MRGSNGFLPEVRAKASSSSSDGGAAAASSSGGAINVYTVSSHRYLKDARPTLRKAKVRSKNPIQFGSAEFSAL